MLTFEFHLLLLFSPKCFKSFSVVLFCLGEEEGTNVMNALRELRNPSEKKKKKSGAAVVKS